MDHTPAILVIQIAALDYALVQQFPELTEAAGMTFYPLKATFPAVTCTAQATLRTASGPEQHGIVANGIYDRSQATAIFWNQSAHLVQGPRVWDAFRATGKTVGMLFWQQSLGEKVDWVMSPAPIHKHGGGMLQDCYALPRSLYQDLARELRTPFRLHSYWGPMASAKSTRWIARATAAVLRRPDAPQLIFTYVPHLDYGLQKFGREPTRMAAAAREVTDAIKILVDAARATGRNVLIWGDYAINDVHHPVCPNRALLEQGLFATRLIAGRSYPDLWHSRAFALVDHQVAHVYVPDSGDLDSVRRILQELPGVDAVLDHGAIPHSRSGELILVAEPDAWFAYNWWDAPATAPDYATHVDIHNKIGFDPCELFWGRFIPPGTTLDLGRVAGSHGRTDEAVCFATDLDFPLQPDTHVELAEALRSLLNAAR